MEHKRQAGQGGNKHPAEDGDEKAVFDVQLIVFSEKPPYRQACRNRDDGGNEEGDQIVFLVIQRTDQGKDHGAAGNDHQLPEYIGD